MRISDQEANRLRVLKAIRRAEPVARTELVQLTGLPSWAVSDLVGDLIQRGLLVEEKGLAVGRGRPRVKLRINADGALVIGVMLSLDLSVEIANLRGDPLFQRSFPVTHGQTLESLAPLIAASVGETIAMSPFDKSAIHSVGVGFPGIVDADRGELHWLRGYGGGPAPIADLVSKALGLPVFLDNTGAIYTRAEHWFGDDRQVDDFTMIYAGFGIAFGQYVDGMLRRGDHGINSEFGHQKVIPGGALCHCGGRGCLTEYAGIEGIVRRICERRARAAPPPLDPLMEAFREFAAEARAGEPVAREVFDFAGLILGVAVANYINQYDPSRIVVVAQDDELPKTIESAFRTSLDENTLGPLRARTTVQLRTTPPAPFSRGAAALVLEELYRGPPPERRR